MRSRTRCIRFAAASAVLLAVAMSCSGACGQTVDQESGVAALEMPAGFDVTVFAEVPNARSMVRGAKGTIFVGNRKGDTVYAVVDSDGDYVGDEVKEIVTGFDTPNGVAFGAATFM